MNDTLTIVDNRTGKKYELPIQDGAIRAMDLRHIKTSAFWSRGVAPRPYRSSMADRESLPAGSL